MKSSLARRLFRTIFAIGLINVLVTLVAVEFIYEDMEDTILRQELAEERAFLASRIEDAEIRTWRSALLTAMYVPDGRIADDLPPIFVDRPLPFSAEVEEANNTYLVSIERTSDETGILYLARDITLLENREDVLQVGIALLGLCMLGLGFLLARIGTRRIVGPLHDLTRHIARIRPGPAFSRIETRYDDHELVEISNTLNKLLDELETYVRREKSLINMASHELRTPVAVIAGALDVMEQRNSLGEADQRTVARIRRATEAMRADVEALLKLARRADGDELIEVIDIDDMLTALIKEMETGAPHNVGRVQFAVAPMQPALRADPALVRMLLRNLVQNAIRHTPGKVLIEVTARGLSIADRGAGLPEHVHSRLVSTGKQEMPEDGLGLFIVRLICERLGWQLSVRQSDAGGTILDLQFSSPGPNRAASEPIGR